MDKIPGLGRLLEGVLGERGRPIAATTYSRWPAGRRRSQCGCSAKAPHQDAGAAEPVEPYRLSSETPRADRATCRRSRRRPAAANISSSRSASAAGRSAFAAATDRRPMRPCRSRCSRTGDSQGAERCFDAVDQARRCQRKPSRSPARP